MAVKMLKNNPLKNVEDFPPTRFFLVQTLPTFAEGIPTANYYLNRLRLPAGISVKLQVHVTA